MTKKQRKTLSEQIRQAAITSGTSQSRLAIALGMSRATMSRFISGKRGLSMENLDALADVLDLHIIVGRPGRKPKAKAKGKR